MRIQAPRISPQSERRVFSGRIRVRVEPLDLESRPMAGSKSFIVLETTLGELFNLIQDSIKSKEA